MPSDDREQLRLTRIEVKRLNAALTFANNKVTALEKRLAVSKDKVSASRK